MVRPPHRPVSASEAIVGLWAAVLGVVLISSLYFMREILIPLALAALLTFLLAPLVTRLERWIGRITAVALVGVLIFAAAGGLMWAFSRQLVDLAGKLPDYRANLHAKMQAFRSPEPGLVSRITRAMKELREELPSTKSATSASDRDRPAAVPTPVEVVESPATNPMELVRTVLAPLVGPLGTTALVALLVACMLLQREDLRGRFIRLVGQGRIGVTRRAMEDAGERVSRFLLMQLLVNAGTGLAVGVGLYFIGVPNAILWGVFTAVLRFIPYLGPWIAATLPILLSLAVSTSWTMPLLTVGLFLVIEFTSNNILEPWLYGQSTGVSTIALIVAALFWTWLWGPIGLVLATPLTVCLVVIGRHAPRLEFLDILLSAEEALTPAEECYHRLLVASRIDDAVDFAVKYRQEHSLTELYDDVLLPALIASERDRQSGTLDDAHWNTLQSGVREILDLTAPVPDPAAAPVAVPRRVLCLAARSQRDELAAIMLSHLLRERGLATEVVDVAAASTAAGDDVCISVFAPTLGLRAQHLIGRLRPHFPGGRFVVGLWGAGEHFPASRDRLLQAGADGVTQSLQESADALVPAPEAVL